MKKVFLGGTCNNSTWREALIPMLERNNIGYFNPVVEDWTEDCFLEELKQREICDYLLYAITPKMLGTYSVAEVVDDSNKRPKRTICYFINTDDENQFTTEQIKSNNAVEKLIKANGSLVVKSFEEIIAVILR